MFTSLLLRLGHIQARLRHGPLFAGAPVAGNAAVRAAAAEIGSLGPDLCRQLRVLLREVTRAVSPRWAAFLVLFPEKGSVEMADGLEVVGLVPADLRLDSPLVSWLRDHGAVARWSELVALPQLQDRAGEEWQWLEERKTEVVVPFQVDGLLTGLLVLGPKSGGAQYQKSDLELLAGLVRATARSIENARMYALAEARIAELEAVNQRKAEAIFWVSHQMKTPITVLKASAEMLIHGQEGPRGSRQFRQRLVAAVSRGVEGLDRLVTELNDYGKMQGSTVELHEVETDMGSLVSEACSLLQPLMHERRQRLEIAIQPGLPRPLVDPHRVQQVVLNLLTNAVKFTPEGGAIAVQVSQKDAQVLTQIRDAGPGIPPEQRATIFEPFGGAPGRRDVANGGGLGLAIAKALVERHGGTIWVEEEEGAGSTFSFALPLRPADGGRQGAVAPELLAQEKSVPKREVRP